MKKRLFAILSFVLPLCSCGPTSSDSVSISIEEPTTNKTLLDKKAKEFQHLANRCNYDFDPTLIEIKEKRTNPDGSELTANDIKELTKSIVNSNEVRMKNGKEIHICYSFDGVFAEGWNGDYSIHKGKAVLYEDGLSLFERDRYSSGGFWWKEGEIIHVSFVRDNKVYEITSSTTEYGLILPIPELGPHRDYERSISAVGGYHYPTIGIFIEDIDLKKEVEADEVFYKTPYGEDCPVYKIDKSLHYYRISSWDDELKFTRIPEWNYPHDDEYIATYQGMTAVYNLKITPSKKNFVFHSSELSDKIFPLYSLDYLKYIEANSADDLAFSFKIKGNELHTYLNPKTDELTAYLPNGRLEKTHVNFSYKEEDNHFEETINGYDFGFTFKNQDSLEISLGSIKETLKISINHEFKSYIPDIWISEHDPSHEGCLLDKLPSASYLKDSRGVRVANLRNII